MMLSPEERTRRLGMRKDMNAVVCQAGRSSTDAHLIMSIWRLGIASQTTETIPPGAIPRSSPSGPKRDARLSLPRIHL